MRLSSVSRNFDTVPHSIILRAEIAPEVAGTRRSRRVYMRLTRDEAATLANQLLRHVEEIET